MTANAALAEYPASDRLPKTARFRRLLAAPERAFIMEAHNELSARIVGEAGFQGLRGSAPAEARERQGSPGKGDVRCLFNRLVAAGHPVRGRTITGQWLDIDDALDPARARNLL